MAAIPASIAFCTKIGLDYVVLLALPRADRASRRGAGGARQDAVFRRVVPSVSARDAINGFARLIRKTENCRIRATAAAFA